MMFEQKGFTALVTTVRALLLDGGVGLKIKEQRKREEKREKEREREDHREERIQITKTNIFKANTKYSLSVCVCIMYVCVWV